MSAGVTHGNVFAENIVSVTFDAASVAANTTAEQSVTVPGVRVGDFVLVRLGTHNAGLFVGNARVTAADTVAVAFGNCTGSAIDAASQTMTFAVLRPEGQVAAARVSA